MRHLVKGATSRRVARVRTPFDGPRPMPPPLVPYAARTGRSGVATSSDDAQRLGELIRAVDASKESLVHSERLCEMYASRLKAGCARQTKYLDWIDGEKSDAELRRWAQKCMLDAGPTFYMKEER